jgi:hypothetical protein
VILLPETNKRRIAGEKNLAQGPFWEQSRGKPDTGTGITVLRQKNTGHISFKKGIPLRGN